ncbi:MAG: choice-of-anchor D domain-containing protein [Candidatus Delongbacteria bacterium]|nr:choice-of-anchor D domain-containing protein [Candidatus Delongbacteria bacterium]
MKTIKEILATLLIIIISGIIFNSCTEDNLLTDPINFNDDIEFTLISPNGGENWQMRSTNLISWTDNISEDVNIELYIEDSIAGRIADLVSDNNFDWTIPDTLIAGTDYRIKITSVTDSNIFDFSDSCFTISEYIDLIIPELQIINPQSPYTVQIGTDISVDMTAFDDVGVDHIDLVIDGITYIGSYVSGTNWTANIPTAGLITDTAYVLVATAFDFATNSSIPDTITVNTSIAPVPTITVDPASLDFDDVQVGNTKDLTFILDGSDLTDDVLITGLTGYTLSEDNISYSPSISYSASDATSGQTVYVRFTPADTLTYNGNIVFTSTGANNVNVAVTGQGSPEPVPTITALPLNIPFGNVELDSSLDRSFTLGGYDLTNDVVINSIEGYTLSEDNISYSPSIIYTAGETMAGQTVYVRFSPSAIREYNGNITLASTGAADVNVAVTGNCIPVPDPVITVAPDSLAFGDIMVGNSFARTFTLGGSDLSSNVIITGLTGYTLSKDDVTYTSIVTYNAADAMEGRTVYVRFTPTDSIAYNGNIRLTSTGADPVNVSVTGAGFIPVISVDHTALYFGDIQIGKTLDRKFDINGSDLLDNVVITAPTGYTLSTDSVTFDSLITYTAAEVMSGQTAFVRFSPTIVQPYNDSITLASTGASTVNVAVYGNGTPLPPSAPTLESPADGSSSEDQTPTLDWSDVPDANEYYIQIDNNSDFSSPEVEALTSLSDYTTSTLAYGTYYWHVRSKNAVGYSTYSSSWTFTITEPSAPATPVLVSPANGSSLDHQNPTFDWDDVTGATEYGILIDNNSSFTSPEIDVTTAVSEYTVFTLPYGTYYWKVRARSTAGTSAFSSLWSLSIFEVIPEVPTLISPADSSSFEDQTPTFDWNDVTGANGYNIQIDNNSDFSSPEIDTSTALSQYTASTMAYGTYYWKVRARNTAGSSAFTSGWTFEITEPKEIIVVSPNGGENWLFGTEYEIRWTDNFVEDVNIWLWKGESLLGPIVTNTPSDSSYFWTTPASLTSGNGTDYRIQITIADGGATSDLSDDFFSLSLDANETMATATGPLAPSTTPVNSVQEISLVNDVDWFNFDLTGGQSYDFQCSDATVDVKYWLYNSSGNLVASDDNSGGGTFGEPIFEYTPPSNGNYYLRVAYYLDSPKGDGDMKAETGDYRLVVEESVP